MFIEKIKYLKKIILIALVISINTSSLDIFANPPSGDSKINKNESTILDGEIGEWDPDLSDKPNFNENGLEVDANVPQQGDYYTISVTVPLNMEFYVIPNNQSALGSFASPIYTIKNNGSKNISVNVSSFNIKNEITDANTAPLYIKKVKHGDGRTQMELKLVSLVDMIYNKFDTEIDLTEPLNNPKELCRLDANKEKGIRFDSDFWEVPKVEANKEQAMSNFRVGFTFSINR